MGSGGETRYDNGSYRFRRHEERVRMVADQIRRRGIADENVLEAMRSVPRHLFVTPDQSNDAYGDHPLPIGYDQTISQPYIVALMTSALGLDKDDRVLEIGTGSGYQTAVLACVAAEVFTVESVAELSVVAEQRLDTLDYANIRFKIGDGFAGWADEAPFDGIMVTAAPREVPETLVAQLRDGRRMVIPVGLDFQELLVITKEGESYRSEKIADVRFVPMIPRPAN